MRNYFLLLLFVCPMLHAQTLEECQRAAENNYPLIKQYDLIDKTTQMTVENIAKDWLPQVSANAQATLQNDVTGWPDEAKVMFQQMGLNMKGLKKDQYRIGVDVNQMIYDGGTIKNNKAVAQQAGSVERAKNEVSLYAIRQRVNQMYFSLLLLDEQIQLNGNLQDLLTANENKLYSMYKRGTASKSDYDNIKAERLNVIQNRTKLDVQREAVQRMLSLLCGIEIRNVVRPQAENVRLGLQSVQRPEMKAFDAQIRLTDMQEKSLHSALLPKLSVFASAFYGYPGYNMFDDMMNHHFSFNAMVGARISWNIGSLYSHKNNKTKLQLQRGQIENQREVFLLNNQLEQIQQNENIQQYRKLIENDKEIIELRNGIRIAAESKLSHGIIDINDLIKDINNENNSRIQLSIHEIELLKEIYDLKLTINN